MKFGLKPSEFQFIKLKVVEPLEALGAKVFCYGSRARGDHKPYSDLDLMIESKNKDALPISFISESIQNSNFPYKVDLVHISEFAQTYKKSYELDRKRLETQE
jgi:uncharacterized protein